MTEELRVTLVEACVLKLEPGDVLAVLVPEKLSQSQVQMVGQSVQRAIEGRGARVLVFDRGMKPAIIRQEVPE